MERSGWDDAKGPTLVHLPVVDAVIVLPTDDISGRVVLGALLGVGLLEVVVGQGNLLTGTRVLDGELLVEGLVSEGLGLRELGSVSLIDVLEVQSEAVDDGVSLEEDVTVEGGRGALEGTLLDITSTMVL